LLTILLGFTRSEISMASGATGVVATSVIDYGSVTRLGSFSQIRLQKLVLADDFSLAAHLDAVAPATTATTFVFCTISSFFRYLGTSVIIKNSAIGIRRLTLGVTLRASSSSSFTKALIASLIHSIVVYLNPTEVHDWKAEEDSNDDTYNYNAIKHIRIFTADAKLLERTI